MRIRMTRALQCPLVFYLHAPIFMPKSARLFLDSRDRPQLVCDKTVSISMTSTITGTGTSRTDMFHPRNVLNNHNP